MPHEQLLQRLDAVVPVQRKRDFGPSKVQAAARFFFFLDSIKLNSRAYLQRRHKLPH